MVSSQATVMSSHLGQGWHLESMSFSIMHLSFSYGVYSLSKRDKRFPNEYHLYELMAPSSTGGLPLSCSSFILITLLCGGDYDKKGLKGCGSSTVFALAQCGFGDQLLDSFLFLCCLAFMKFLIEWCHSIWVELWTNSFSFLTMAMPNLTNNISETFPSYWFIDLYVNPFTSWSPSSNLPGTSLWQFGQPNIAAIAYFVMQHFQWRQPEVIKAKFAAYLWEGVGLQMIYSVSHLLLQSSMLLIYC